MKRRWIAGVAVLGLVGLAAAAVAWLNLRDEAPLTDTAPLGATTAQVQRGAYLALAGNCAGCHTARGGTAYAGGRGIETPFGTVYAGNLTPDPDTGLGRWTPAHFWRALHNGRSFDGRLLYPAFPYPHFTRITREDSDALYAYLRSLSPVAQAPRPHALRFPYDSQLALAVWRALFFTPTAQQPEAGRSAEWNRGSYLVRGLGHCSACHASRNLLGAQSDEQQLGGATIPMQDWYAPALNAAAEAGVAGWDLQQVVQLLKTGTAPRGSVLGPMADVVFRSTQHLQESDLRAMAVYLQSLPQAPVPAKPASGPASSAASAAVALNTRGQKLYDRRCADCHGADGRGVPGAYPPLAGNRAVTMASTANLVLVVINGGFPPATAGNPRPYGMPPFGHELSAAEVADVLSYIRAAWGNEARPVTALEVLQ
ncbi:cytochrome c [Aquabacterium sp.]|uniref:cytochrome c n=1 Tax=Aquabacterium sp. TaxID=1872578 RepID=UPI002D000DA5|nr:cytochrome c [Aquabacterium sp.]HSW03657.1 cytochrome c [Aquabacterium sp.]